jgi:hypothetical protein
MRELGAVFVQKIAGDTPSTQAGRDADFSNAASLSLLPVVCYYL